MVPTKELNGPAPAIHNNEVANHSFVNIICQSIHN
jgi:hypothetical protein